MCARRTRLLAAARDCDGISKGIGIGITRFYSQLTRPAGYAVTDPCFVIAHSIVATLTGILAVQSPTIMITTCKYQINEIGGAIPWVHPTLRAVLAGVTFLAATDVGHEACATSTASTAYRSAAGLIIRKISLVSKAAEANDAGLVHSLETKNKSEWTI